MKHKHESEKNGLSTNDYTTSYYTNHDNDDYETKKISVESDQDFQKDLHKMNSENGDMVVFSGYNLQNLDHRIAKLAEKDKKDFKQKQEMLDEAENVRKANNNAKTVAERALMTDIEVNLEAKLDELDKESHNTNTKKTDGV